MKLIIWNKANSCSPATYAQRRTIRVNRHGYIYLSGALTAEMELRDGCRLNLANDEQNPKDWYLCRTQSTRRDSGSAETVPGKTPRRSG
ncbi:MAG: hypothetical protein ACLVK4_16965 [Alistipes shahii]|uniref:hypothetical protein n=1 Tax=Alistipes shahii TaxID=328814 RepID=UPI00399D3E1E